MSGLMCRFALCTLVAMVGNVAYAQARPAKTVDAIRLGGHVSLGFGGEYEASADGQSVDDDLETTFGVDAFCELPVHTYLVLGAGARFSAFNTDPWARNGWDRSTLLDLTFTPKLRYPFLRGASLTEIYAALPLGLTSASLSDDLSRGEVVFEGGMGFTAGVLAGANVFFSEAVALSIELGYVHHAFGTEVTSKLSTATADMDFSLSQVRLNMGLLIALR